MTRAAQIRQWLADNPGWHFSGDVCDGLGIGDAPLRAKFARSLSNMATAGVLASAGHRGTMRFQSRRAARKLERQVRA